MAELLALMHVRDVYLDDGALQTPDAVVQRHACMGVGPSVEHDAIVASKEARLLHLVDQLALHVTLIVVDLYLWEPFAQLWQVAFERLRAIDARLPLAQQVQVRPVDNLYLHTLLYMYQAAKVRLSERKTKYFCVFLRCSLSSGVVERLHQEHTTGEIHVILLFVHLISFHLG